MDWDDRIAHNVSFSGKKLHKLGKWGECTFFCLKLMNNTTPTINCPLGKFGGQFGILLVVVKYLEATNLVHCLFALHQKV